MSLILVITNTSELAAVSDYEWYVSITLSHRDNPGVAVGERVIETGIVRGHVRADGWAALVQRLLDQRRP